MSHTNPQKLNYLHIVIYNKMPTTTHIQFHRFTPNINLFTIFKICKILFEVQTKAAEIFYLNYFSITNSTQL